MEILTDSRCQDRARLVHAEAFIFPQSTQTIILVFAWCLLPALLPLAAAPIWSIATLSARPGLALPALAPTDAGSTPIGLADSAGRATAEPNCEGALGSGEREQGAQPCESIAVIAAKSYLYHTLYFF